MEAKEVWRMGIRDSKDYKRWYWSKEYNTCEELMAASTPYIASNPGVVFKVIKRNIYPQLTSK